jgi:hypothetical protein
MFEWAILPRVIAAKKGIPCERPRDPHCSEEDEDDTAASCSDDDDDDDDDDDNDTSQPAGAKRHTHVSAVVRVTTDSMFV